MFGSGSGDFFSGFSAREKGSLVANAIQVAGRRSGMVGSCHYERDSVWQCQLAGYIGPNIWHDNFAILLAMQ